MNDDLLKSFVQEHRKEFDTHQAPSRVWDRVEKDLGESPKPNRWSRTSKWLIAVGISILFLGGIAIGSYWNSTANDQGLQYAQIEDEEYQELNHFYSSRLNKTQQQFASYPASQEILPELDDLQSGFHELQKDFVHSDADNRELIMSLMKENYELRIKIIELAMERMSENQIPSKQNNQKTNYDEY